MSEHEDNIERLRKSFIETEASGQHHALQWAIGQLYEINDYGSVNEYRRAVHDALVSKMNILAKEF